MADLKLPDYQSRYFIQRYLFKMPSSLNLFMRVPKGANERDVFDAVSRKDICKVIDVIIKKGKTYNNATVLIDYWYTGTRHIREALIRGEPVSIPNRSPDNWLAFEFKSKIAKPAPQSVPVRPSNVDEFGRDISRKSKPDLTASAHTFIPIAPALKIAPTLPIAPTLIEMLPPFVTDNRAERARNNYRENDYAAEAFIQQYEQCDYYATPEKMAGAYDYKVAPWAPVKQEPDEVFDEELNEVVQRLDNTFIDEPADNISEITDGDYCAEEPAQEKKTIYIPKDFDQPSEPVLEVKYDIAFPIKKRNIRFIKSK